MKTSIITIIMLLLITTGVASQELSTNENDRAYSIEAPRGWKVTESNGEYPEVVYTEPQGKSIITVSTFKREGVEAKAYAEKFLRNFSEETGLEVKSEESAVVVNATVYKAELADSKRDCNLALYINNDNIYVVVAAAQKQYYKKNRNQLTKVTNSFRAAGSR